MAALSSAVYPDTNFCSDVTCIACTVAALQTVAGFDSRCRMSSRCGLQYPPCPDWKVSRWRVPCCRTVSKLTLLVSFMPSFYSCALAKMNAEELRETPKKGRRGGPRRTSADREHGSGKSPPSSKGVRSKTKHHTAPLRLPHSALCKGSYQIAKKCTTEGPFDTASSPEVRMAVAQPKRICSLRDTRDAAEQSRVFCGQNSHRTNPCNRFQGLSETLRHKLSLERQKTRHFVLGGDEGQGLGTALEPMLQRFDMAVQYGPCCGLSRSERWYRADELGMEPPLEVKQAIQFTRGDASIFDQRLSRFGVTNLEKHK
uniref:DNA polymerase delta subunit 4 n=1 Tax=Toxoplasma gondii COUG TaxID=1074873 RepID=A0A2G8XTR1_TOXGO|nr:DNA polymerase delta subunit 4 [Toxoplasma gondii COUG]